MLRHGGIGPSEGDGSSQVHKPHLYYEYASKNMPVIDEGVIRHIQSPLSSISGDKVVFSLANFNFADYNICKSVVSSPALGDPDTV